MISPQRSFLEPCHPRPRVFFVDLGHSNSTRDIFVFWHLQVFVPKNKNQVNSAPLSESMPANITAREQFFGVSRFFSGTCVQLSKHILSNMAPPECTLRQENVQRAPLYYLNVDWQIWHPDNCKILIFCDLRPCNQMWHSTFSCQFHEQRLWLPQCDEHTWAQSSTFNSSSLKVAWKH